MARTDSTNSDQDTNQNQNQNTNSTASNHHSIHLDPSQPSSPYFISTNDHSGALLVTQVLDSSNYHPWARSMKRALRIKNKLGFIDGSIREPIDPDSSLMDHCLRCNDIVITWLQNSMSVDIKCSTLYAETAHQLWVELEHRLAQQNAPRIYENKQGIAALMQQQDSVSCYFSKLKILLDELMNYESIPSCSCGGLKKVIENQMKFLMGLNDSYKGLKAQILLIKPFPNLNEVYSIIQQEEKRREISFDPSLIEPLALLVKDNTRQLTPQKSSQRRDKYYCSHCKIHGRTPPIGSYAHQVSASPLPIPEQGTHGGQSTITQEQYQELMAILRQTNPASVHSVQTTIASPPDAHIPQFSGIPLCLSAYTSKPKDISAVPWIIDTGATDHMVCATCFFTSKTAEVSYSVTLPNGEAVTVTHIGTVRPTKDLILHNVLCVPSFSFNLISARKLAHTLKCCLIFLSKNCFIQDLLT
ncbi:uncharacterized protein LOC131163461 [Malania oleifera]|uniref:uncharacterized protein LOC131163461 n=1 Tax=Malania oleifera TaxID=397392 RepID=UPI0025AE4805|nr:uncharacterized protein LOC131163461 [Malania oleifera]